MVLISLNRYTLMYKPFKHYKVTSRKSTLAEIAAFVTILLVVNIFYIFSHKDKTIYYICFLVVYVLLSHITPILISAVLTILVIYEFTKTNRINIESVNTASRQGEKNITKATTAVDVAFVVLTMPHAVSHTVYVILNLLHDGNPVADEQINNSFVAILILTLLGRH